MLAHTILNVAGLSIGFRAKASNGSSNEALVLRGFGIRLEAGEIVGLVGATGAGKTLAALALLGLLPNGARILGGKAEFRRRDGTSMELLGASEKELGAIRGGEIGMVFQEPATALNPVLRCGFQVAEVLRRHGGMGSAAAKKAAIEALERVELDNAERVYAAYPHELSGGQQQRVVIAMALAGAPQLLIADEPTAALDAETGGKIVLLLRSLCEEAGIAVLFISHDRALLATIADRIVGMDGEVLTGDHKASRVVHQAGDSEAAAATKSSAVLLRGQDIKHIYRTARGEVAALQGVSLAVHRGEAVGLMGDSGSGKTTLGRVLLRLIAPTDGQIFWQETNTTAFRESELRPLRRNFQLISQNPAAALNPRQRVGDAVAECLAVHHIGDSAGQRRERVVELLEQVGLTAGHYRRYPHEFSGGQRQRIAIARALSLEPSLIVCDECVSALDVEMQAQILELLLHLRERLGLSYLFISHNLEAVTRIADRILVMREGKLVTSE